MKTKTMAMAMAMAAAAACAAAAGGEGGAKALGPADKTPVPAKTVYQGVLNDPVDGPLTGELKVTFRIYDEKSGGKELWGKEQTVNCSTGGLFNAVLTDEDTRTGSTNLVDAFSSPSRFLGVSVEGHGGEIEPRQEFTAAPQALHAVYARCSPLGFAVASNLTVKGKLALSRGGLLADDVTAGHLKGEGLMVVAGDLKVSGKVKARTFEGDGILPVGSIVIWNLANQFPEGWALCDGQTVNGHKTPDLRGRFPVGVDPNRSDYVLGRCGGAATVTLTVEELPSHTHSYEIAETRDYGEVGAHKGSDWWHGLSTSMTATAGNGEAHENMPPYAALCYIMRVK